MTGDLQRRDEGNVEVFSKRDCFKKSDRFYYSLFLIK